MTRSGLLLAFALAISGGCARTEVLVGVATDIEAPGTVDLVRLSVSREGVELFHNDWDISGIPNVPNELPGSFGVYSADGSETKVEITVSGFKNGSVVELVRRDSILKLVSGRTLFLRMGLVIKCMASNCSPGQTCIEGVCKDPNIDAHMLPDFTDDLVTHVTCDSGTVFLDTSTKQPMPLLGDAQCAGPCVEGTCYNPLPDDGGTSNALWMPEALPSSAQNATLNGIWGIASPYDVFAVGDDGAGGGKILHLAGGAPTQSNAWTEETLPAGTPALFGVSGTSVNDVWAVGSGGVILHRAAGGWTADPTAPSGAQLRGVYAPSTSQAIAVGATAGGSGPHVELWNGSQWTIDSTFPGTLALNAVSGFGTEIDVVGAGNQGFNLKNGTWSSLGVPISDTNPDLLGLWVSPDGNGGIIVGSRGFLVNALSKTGGGTIEPSGTQADLTGAWASGPNDLYAIGKSGVIVHSQGNGSWQMQPSSTKGDILAIWGSGPGDVYAVGASGTVLHSTGGGGPPLDDGGIVQPPDAGFVVDMGVGCPPNGCILLQGLPQPFTIAVDNKGMYWVNKSGSVMQANTDGTNPIMLAQGLTQPFGLAIDLGTVFYSEVSAGRISRADKGVALSGASIITGRTSPVHLATNSGPFADASQIFWAEATQVLMAPAGGGTVTTMANGRTAANSVASDGINVFFTDFTANGIVGQVPINMPLSLTTLAPSQNMPGRVTTDSKNVYWTNNAAAAAGSVNQVQISQTTITPLATNRTNPNVIATDGSNVYWAEGVAGGGVFKVPVGGGAMTPIATNQGTPNGIAVDGTFVYWTTQTGGEVRRALK